MTPSTAITEITRCTEGRKCTWKFDVTIKLDLYIELIGNPFSPSYDCNCKQLGMHEDAHADDLTKWCKELDSKTEGFKNPTECEVMQQIFVRDLASWGNKASRNSGAARDCPDPQKRKCGDK